MRCGLVCAEGWGGSVFFDELLLAGNQTRAHVMVTMEDFITCLLSGLVLAGSSASGGRGCAGGIHPRPVAVRLRGTLELGEPPLEVAEAMEGWRR